MPPWPFCNSASPWSMVARIWLCMSARSVIPTDTMLPLRQSWPLDASTTTLALGEPGRDPSQFPGVQVARTSFGNIRGFLQADVRMINPGVFEVANLYPGHFKFTVQVQGAGEMIEESGEMDVVDSSSV